MASNAECLNRVSRYVQDVVEVCDATTPISVTVTQADIKKADKGSHTTCAMAHAFMRNGWDAAVIKRTTAYLVCAGIAIRYTVPQSVSREIVSFDRHGDFYPGKYMLSPICPGSRIGVKGKKPSLVRKTGRAYPRHQHRTKGIR